MRHLVIPDTQVKPDYDQSHLDWIAKYAVAKKPDTIIVIGDWWDLPSLSSYDVGKKSFEGRRYVKDIEAGKEAMERFLAPIRAESARLVRNKQKGWNPRLVFCVGNHENRIARAVESDPKLDGLLSINDLGLEGMGFEVVPFLQPIVIDGIAYCHYFTSGVMGRPVSSARILLLRKMMSCVMGHVQDRDIAYGRRADGVNMIGLFSGICYLHDEDYLTPQTNGSWRGIWLLNEVENGGCDELPVSLRFLKKKYA
jgi:hypothetical protein